MTERFSYADIARMKREPDVPSVPSSVPRNLESRHIPRHLPSVPREKRDERSERSRERHKYGQLNVSVPLELIEQLRLISIHDRRPVADIVEQLVYAFVAARNAVPSVPRHLSMMIDDDVESVSNIISQEFQTQTGKAVTQTDRAAVADFVRTLPAKPDQWAIKAGFLLGRLRTKQKQINSVKYFFGPIIEVVESPPSDWKTYAQHIERKMKRNGEF